MAHFENFLEKADKAMGIVSGMAAALCALVVVVMTLAVTAYVIARGIFHQSWVFAEEFSGYGVVLIVYFGLAYTLRTRGHISIEWAIGRLPPQARKVLEALTTLVALGIVALLMQSGIRWVQRAIEMGMRSPFPSESPMWFLHLMVPLGLGILGLELVLYFIHRVRALAGEEEKKMPSISGE